MGKRNKKAAAPPVEKFGDRLIARNRRASYDYELTDKFEAGLVLVGSEVKMLREGTADLSDAYVHIHQGEAWIEGMNIPERSGGHWGHTGKRSRKLLLHRHQIEQIARATERDGMTCVATQIYFRGGRAKVEIALAKGKARFDKRETIKRREADREARAAIDRHVRGGS